MNRPRISSLADHDNKLARFERTSGLPFGYFDAPWWRRALPDGWVLILLLLCALVGFIVADRPL